MASLTQYRDNLAQWWVQDKISGTILPILIAVSYTHLRAHET